jgi:acetyl esterase/lipase
MMPPVEIPLWPDEIPLRVPDLGPEQTEFIAGPPPNRHIRNIAKPTLTIFPAASSLAALVCPGGGYQFVSFDKEGLDVARWLQERGISGAALKYRLPAPGTVADGHLTSLVDAQRAMQLLRGRTTGQVGIIGFSAGGHLAACVSNWPAIQAGRISCRPDFSVLIYPVISALVSMHTGSRGNLLGPDAPDAAFAEFSCERRVTAQTPPAFLVHARDDGTVPFANSEMYAAACRQAGVPVELHLYDHGGHGFGLGVNGGEVAGWPARLEKFLDRFR